MLADSGRPTPKRRRFAVNPGIAMAILTAVAPWRPGLKVLLGCRGRDAHLFAAAAGVPLDPGIGEAVRAAPVCERAGLLGDPAMTGEAGRAGPAQALNGHEPAARLED